MNENDSDISLAMRVDDISLIECVFHAAPVSGRSGESRLAITNPEKHFSLDVKNRQNVLRAMVAVQFGIADPSAPAGEKGEIPEFLHFGMLVGVVATSPLMGEAAIAARHMAGSEDSAAAQRDKKMEHAMRLEAIKTAYAFATSKLAEMSAMSPMGVMVLPLIDADQILIDIEKADKA